MELATLICLRMSTVVLYGLQGLNYLLSGPLQKNFAKPLLQTVVSQGGAMFVLLFIVIQPWPGACTEQALNGDMDACFFDN